MNVRRFPILGSRVAASHAIETALPLSAEFLATSRRGYIVRRLPTATTTTLVEDIGGAAPGDVVLVKVEGIGRLRSFEFSDGSVARLVAGDQLVACLGDIEDHGALAGRFCLASAAGMVIPDVHRFSNETTVRILGIVGDESGAPLNIARWAELPVPIRRRRPAIVTIDEPRLPGEACRTADVVRGLAGSGFRVGVANILGPYPLWKAALMRRAGASLVLDVVDAGRVSARQAGEPAVGSIFQALIGRLAAEGVEAMVLHIEADVFDHDVAGLITLPAFQSQVSSLVLEARDGTASSLACDSLRAMGFDVTVFDSPGLGSRYRRLV